MARPQLNITTLDFYAGAAGNYIVDIPKALSIYNRKSYRAGYVYSVDYIEYVGTAGDNVLIGQLPNTYVTLQAYKLGFELWKSQRSEAMQAEGTEPGKWSDFKPFYNISHMDNSWPEMSPRGLGTGLTMQVLDLTNVEWNRAEIVTNDIGAATTTSYGCGMLGDDDLAANYVSLIEGYGDTRVATLAPDPLLPTTASDSWVQRTGEASGEMTSDVVTLVEDENDFPPYANQNDVTLPATYVGNSQSAPGGILMDRSVAGTTGRSVTLNGGLVPLGLLAVSTAGGGFTLRVHLTRGLYKGVAAMPMGDFS